MPPSKKPSKSTKLRHWRGRSFDIKTMFFYDVNFCSQGLAVLFEKENKNRDFQIELLSVYDHLAKLNEKCILVHLNSFVKK